MLSQEAPVGAPGMRLPPALRSTKAMLPGTRMEEDIVLRGEVVYQGQSGRFDPLCDSEMNDRKGKFPMKNRWTSTVYFEIFLEDAPGQNLDRVAHVFYARP